MAVDGWTTLRLMLYNSVLRRRLKLPGVSQDSVAVSFGHNTKHWDSKTGKRFLISSPNVSFSKVTFLSLLLLASQQLHYFRHVCRCWCRNNHQMNTNSKTYRNNVIQTRNFNLKINILMKASALSSFLKTHAVTN